MRLLMQHIRDLSVFNDRLDGTDCYLLIVLRCWSSSNGTSGLIPRSVQAGLLFLARASSVNVTRLIDVGLLKDQTHEWLLTEIKNTPKVTDDVAVERILIDADIDPERSHWRSCLSSQETISKPINAGRWRLAVLKNWKEGIGTPSTKQIKSASVDETLDKIAEFLMTSENADGLILPKRK